VESTHRLTPIRDGQQCLELHGSFPPHWPGHLTAGLAGKKISILSGNARKKQFEWNASFTLDFSRFLGLPDKVNYVELAQTEPAGLPDEAIRLDDFVLRRLASGDVEVTITGPDQIGFLARFLRKVTFLSLFPKEFDIDTIGGAIRDRFVFGGIGSLKPTAAVEEILNKTLKGLVE